MTPGGPGPRPRGRRGPADGVRARSSAPRARTAPNGPRGRARVTDIAPDPRPGARGAAVRLGAMKRSVLTRYRVMAYVTGVLLVLLTLGVIGKYLLGIEGADSFTSVVGIAHGWLYVVYLIFAFDLGAKAKWPVGKQVWVLLAGTVPTAAFFVERKISKELEPAVAEDGTAVAKA